MACMKTDIASHPNRVARQIAYRTDRFLALLALVLTLGLALPVSAATYRDNDVADGFYKTVFGAEIGALSWGSQTKRVKKYVTPVKVWIDNRAKLNRMKYVRRFVRSLPGQIRGLKLRMARTPKEANFRIYIVDARDYQKTVRREIFRNDTIEVPGQCIVRVLSRRSGITRSDAVIVSDQGFNLFRRCMVEEILQGLGPVNDDPSLTYSIFNDHSQFVSFTHYDRMILNMLYHPEVKPGMTKRQVKSLVPDLVRYARTVTRKKQ